MDKIEKVCCDLKMNSGIMEKDIPTVSSTKGIINSVRLYKQSKGNKNDCWSIALSLATEVDYETIRILADSMGAVADDGCIYLGYDRRIVDLWRYTRRVEIEDNDTIVNFVSNSDKDKHYIIWCRNNDKDERKPYNHLIYAHNNQIWDDKKTRLDWEVISAYEVKRDES